MISTRDAVLFVVLLVFYRPKTVHHESSFHLSCVVVAAAAACIPVTPKVIGPENNIRLLQVMVQSR